MAYPKPLSEKSIEKMKLQSGLAPEVIDTIYQLFEACSYLYGTIHIDRAWDVYKQLASKTSVVKIKRKDLVTVSSITRRDAAVGYQVLEVDELYTDKRNELYRAIINKDLLLPFATGLTRYRSYYKVIEESNQRPAYVPLDLLTIQNRPMHPDKKKLIDYLGHLKSVSDMCKPSWGKEYPNENKGKYLKDFKWLDRMDQSSLEYYSKNKVAIQYLNDKQCGNVAEMLVNEFLDICSCGGNVNHAIQSLFNDLSELGTNLNEKKFEKLTKLLMDCYNSANQWALMGWAPVEFAKAYPPKGGLPKQIVIGENMKKMIANGEIDLEELEQQAKALGIEIVFE